MGTVFCLHTREKKYRDKWFEPGEYELTDFPEFGYIIPLAKTSGGWLPIFASHKNIGSVADIKKVYDDGGFMIVDEYGIQYDWDAFSKRVINFGNADSISHIEYEKGRYKNMFFKDECGYEFMRHMV